MTNKYPADPEMRKRMADLYRDYDLLKSGWRPNDQTLKEAPIIGAWRLVPRGAGLALAGVVTGHPRLGNNKPIVTSPLVAFDEKNGWARTEGRFYVLGASYASMNKPTPRDVDNEPSGPRF